MERLYGKNECARHHLHDMFMCVWLCAVYTSTADRKKKIHSESLAVAEPNFPSNTQCVSMQISISFSCNICIEINNFAFFILFHWNSGKMSMTVCRNAHGFYTRTHTHSIIQNVFMYLCLTFTFNISSATILDVFICVFAFVCVCQYERDCVCVRVCAIYNNRRKV